MAKKSASATSELSTKPAFEDAKIIAQGLTLKYDDKLKERAALISRLSSLEEELVSLDHSIAIFNPRHVRLKDLRSGDPQLIEAAVEDSAPKTEAKQEPVTATVDEASISKAKKSASKSADTRARNLVNTYFSQFPVSVNLTSVFTGGDTLTANEAAEAYLARFPAKFNDKAKAIFRSRISAGIAHQTNSGKLMKSETGKLVDDREYTAWSLAAPSEAA